jgi:hypothetical protein
VKRFFAALLTVTLAGLTYVYAEVEAVKIGYRIRKQEEQKVLFLDRARALQYNIARLKAPHNLERKLSAQRIALESPKSWRTLVLAGPAKPASAAPAPEIARPPFFGRLFMGTAQAEAKETAR